jgi:thiopeptide-type bacteriocin biosynthesis protein
MTGGRAGGPSARRRPHRYQAAGFFMIRAPLLPAAAYRRLTAPQPGPAARLGLLGEPLAAAALAAASGELYGRLQSAEGRAGLGDPASRLSRSVFRYLNRMTTRPTPFGLLAAVGTGLFDGSTSLRLGRDPLERVVLGPDMAWLEAVLRAAVDSPAWSGPVWLTGDTVSVRASSLVRAILALARRPVRAEELTARLAARYRRADPAQLQRLVQELGRLDFLRADLGLDPAGPDPCAAAARIAGLGAVGASLAGIGRDLGEMERLGPARLSPARLLDLERRQRALAPGYTASTFRADAALSLRGRGLHRSVGAAVADAVTALAAAGTGADGAPPLRDYALAFLERYGPGEEVPVLELLDPHTGLDAPRGYRWPAPAFAPAETAGHDPPGREHLLLGWIQQAMFDDGPVELTEQRIGQLARGAVSRPPPPLLDVYVQVHAASPEAIDRGDWLAAIAPMGIVPGGRSFGRFHRLLPPDVTDRLRAFLGSEQELEPGPVFAELSYRPAETRMRNVSGHARLRRYEIPVDVRPSVPQEDVIGLDDLLIGLHDGRFSIRSRRLQRPVVAVQSHMLSPVRAPNVCRFLLEVSAGRYGPIWSFRDPVLARLPYCPRITYGKVVLAAARWNLTRELLGDAGEAGTAIGAWRQRFRAPRHVYLVSQDDDQRLLLDLEDPASRAELARAISRLDDDPVSSRHYQGLAEVLPDFDGLWLADENGESRFCELVVPLALTQPVSHPADAAAAAGADNAPAQRRVSPGGVWTQLQLYAAADRHDQLIVAAARHAGELVDCGQAASWFFIRYADPAPHIRLRVQAAGPQLSNAVLERTVAWARGLAETCAVREFGVGTYRREAGRYGGAAGLAQCERIFYGDSVGVSRVLAAGAGPEPGDLLVTAALTLDQLLTALGLGDTDKMELGYLRRVPFRADDAHRRRRARLVELLRAARGGAPQAAQLTLDQRYGPGARLCAAPGAALRSLPLSRRWPAVIDSIAHMHLNRMTGTGREAEIEAAVLLRSGLLALGHQERLRPWSGAGDPVTAPTEG